MTLRARGRRGRLPTVDLSSPTAGMSLGEYRLIGPIALGGMGETWLARLLASYGFSRLVVLKTIRAELARDPAIRERFLEEARIGAKLHHANLIGALEVAEKRGILFMVLPYVEGVSLAGLSRNRRLPLGIAVRILIDALSGLDAAHSLRDARGVPLELVHQDFTPHNVLVGSDGVSRLIDFGIATFRGQGSAVDEQAGKPGYRSPEQVAGAPVDARSDIYSAGVVLWEALTGERSLDSARTQQSIPRLLLDVVSCALAEDPGYRFARADQMVEALEQAVSELRIEASARSVRRFVEQQGRDRIDELRALAKEQVARPPPLPRPASDEWSQDVTEIESSPGR